jgi:hypothetical protein
MAKTRKALGNSPYIAGLFIGNKQFAQENGDQEITARCFYQLSAGGYLGILLWNNMHLDGRGMQAFAEFSKGVTRFESYLRDDLKLKDGSKYVKGLPQDCVHIFRNKGKLLYLLINRSGIERKISFAIPEEIFKAPEAFDFYVNKTFSPRKPWNEYSIPANKARLIEIKGKTSF